MHGDKNGFTIVELLVAMIVAVIMVAGINSIYITHMVQAQKTRNLALINSFVENKVETLRSIGFLGLSEGTTSISSELPAELYTPKSGTVQITSQTSGLKRVVISVTYNDQGTPRNYAYTTYIGELGVGQY